MSASKSQRQPESLGAHWLGQGEIGAIVRSREWGDSLGPLKDWPESLRTTLAIALASPLPMLVTWGPTSRLFYNDAFRPLLGPSRHPEALGGSAAEFLPDPWSLLGPAFDRVRAGEAVLPLTWYLPLARNGDFENRWFAISPAAMRDESGAIGGVLGVLVETTERVDAERRVATVRELAVRIADAHTSDDVLECAAPILERNPIDIPFGVIYLIDSEAGVATRECVIGLPPDHPSSPLRLPLDAPSPAHAWPIARIVQSGQPETLSGLTRSMGRLPGGVYPEATRAAVLVPLGPPVSGRITGVLVVGACPRRSLDQPYREFIDLTASLLGGALCQAQTLQHAGTCGDSDTTSRPAGEATARGLTTLSAAPLPAAGHLELESLREQLDLASATARATRHDADTTHRAEDEFLALLGHELRDPLAPMTLVLRLMRHESGSEDMFPKEREILERQIARLAELVDDLRDVSRMTRGGVALDRRRIALSSVLERAMEMATPLLERHGHDVALTVAPTGLELDADLTRLAQAIAGLVTSAVRHAEAGGRIEVGALRHADEAIVTIRDVGRGAEAAIPATELAADGRSARPPPRRDRGLGVGFPILRNIIALHGGWVRATGDDATGGFDVHLPLSTPSAGRSEPAASPRPS